MTAVLLLVLQVSGIAQATPVRTAHEAGPNEVFVVSMLYEKYKTILTRRIHAGAVPRKIKFISINCTESDFDPITQTGGASEHTIVYILDWSTVDNTQGQTKVEQVINRGVLQPPRILATNGIIQKDIAALAINDLPD